MHFYSCLHENVGLFLLIFFGVDFFNQRNFHYQGTARLSIPQEPWKWQAAQCLLQYELRIRFLKPIHGKRKPQAAQVC